MIFSCNLIGYRPYNPPLLLTELYLKRARKMVAKMMRLQWTQDTESKRPLGNNGGVAGGREIPSAALQKYRKNLQIESSSS